MDSMGPPPGRPPVNLPKDPFLEGSTLNHPHAPYTVAPHTVKEEGWSAYWDSMRDLEIKSRCFASRFFPKSMVEEA